MAHPEEHRTTLQVEAERLRLIQQRLQSDFYEVPPASEQIAAAVLPGIEADMVDDQGNRVPAEVGAGSSSSGSRGRRCSARSGATTSGTSRRTGRGSREVYFAGDGAKKDDDGDLWLLGRVDDVMNVSGHRISTTEVESALVSHPKVAEAAVVGATDPVTGQAIVAFVILRGGAGRRAVRRCRRAARARRQGDRPDRQAAADHGRARAAEDPVRQDHAAAAPRRRREPLAR